MAHRTIHPGGGFLTFIAVAAAACHSVKSPQLVQPGAPGRASHVVTAERAVDLGSSRATAADVAFMQEMIGHHAQAVEMVALLNARTTREDMRLLGLKIEVSQSDEIRMMQRWLEARGQPLPGPHAHHGEGTTLMPGMLTPKQMEALKNARGAEFDRLFLTGMIQHHNGALTMVKDLYNTAGAGQDAELFSFTTDVDSGQRAEIKIMQTMLDKKP